MQRNIIVEEMKVKGVMIVRRIKVIIEISHTIKLDLNLMFEIKSHTKMILKEIDIEIMTVDIEMMKQEGRGQGQRKEIKEANHLKGEDTGQGQRTERGQGKGQNLVKGQDQRSNKIINIQTEMLLKGIDLIETVTEVREIYLI